MTPQEVSNWMHSKIVAEGCLYQDDVVDFLVMTKTDELLKENSEGNLVLGTKVLEAFRSLTSENVVWVRPDFYWRIRVPEDEEGREARG